MTSRKAHPTIDLMGWNAINIIILYTLNFTSGRNIRPTCAADIAYNCFKAFPRTIIVTDANKNLHYACII